MTSIPEALRLVPGMQVGRLDANKWAVSARGFNDRLARKLLVLIDGRNVYSPIFSGVFWEVQDVLLEDVDRIEVIRGTGATLWGENAVNGIINIITRHARDTQGGLVTLGGGSEERGFTGVRYGGRISEGAFYRVYAKYFDRDRFVDAAGRPTADDWSMFRGGFRSDWRLSADEALTVQGDLFSGKAGQTFQIPNLIAEPFLDRVDADSDLSGGNLLARWERTLSDGSNLQLQLYYDRNERGDLTTTIIDRDTYDADFQHRFAWRSRQEIVWGLGYRYSRDAIEGSYKISFDPTSSSYDLFSGFVQDDITLVADRLSLSLGSKFEHNDFSGFEYQPGARLLWTPDERQTLWGGVTRAVRTPARADRDVHINLRSFLSKELLAGFGLDLEPDPAVALVVVKGNPAFGTEKIRAYEVGYRIRPQPALLIDLAAYYNDYDDLRSGSNEFPVVEDDPVPHLAFGTSITNFMHGTARGLEMSADWQVADDRARLRGAYTYLDLDLDVEPGGNRDSDLVEIGNSEHQFYLWSALNLRWDLSVDAIFRYAGPFPKSFLEDTPYADRLPSRDIDGYFTLDLRLGWRPRPELELSLTGQNLLDSHRPEHSDFFIDSMPTENQRGAYGAVSWSF